MEYSKGLQLNDALNEADEKIDDFFISSMLIRWMKICPLLKTLPLLHDKDELCLFTHPVGPLALLLKIMLGNKAKFWTMTCQVVDEEVVVMK